MKSEAVVAILASEGLAQVAVSCQHARRSFVPQCTLFFVCIAWGSFHCGVSVFELLASSLGEKIPPSKYQFLNSERHIWIFSS